MLLLLTVAEEGTGGEDALSKMPCSEEARALLAVLAAVDVEPVAMPEELVLLGSWKCTE